MLDTIKKTMIALIYRIVVFFYYIFRILYFYIDGTEKKFFRFCQNNNSAAYIQEFFRNCPEKALQYSVKKLLKKSTRWLNKQTRETLLKTLLITACTEGRVDVIELLLAKSTSPSKKDTQKKILSPMLPEIHSFLKERDTQGRTLLLRMLYAPLSPQNTAIIKTLCVHADASNINAEDNNKNSALMVAVQLMHAEAVKLLLEKGADSHRKNLQGKTALCLALEDFKDTCNPTEEEILTLLIEKADPQELQNMLKAILNKAHCAAVKFILQEKIFQKIVNKINNLYPNTSKEIFYRDILHAMSTLYDNVHSDLMKEMIDIGIYTIHALRQKEELPLQSKYSTQAQPNS